MDLSEPTLVPRQESERYLLAVAHFARKISREKQMMKQRERNLVLRFSTARSYLSRKYHPYKRIHDNGRGDIGVGISYSRRDFLKCFSQLQDQPNAAELDRFLDAVSSKIPWSSCFDSSFFQPDRSIGAPRSGTSSSCATPAPALVCSCRCEWSAGPRIVVSDACYHFQRTSSEVSR